ncbi:MAG: DsrE family protein [Gammaproteobacteria bacterium]|nr:DsrE family protein [Gammaproteobacteria bacterium]
MRQITFLLVIVLVVLLSGCAANIPESDGVHRIVIQVSTDDPRTQTMALNNAINIKKAYNNNNAKIEVVAYGPGLSLLMASSTQARRIQDMVEQGDVTFSACDYTMQAIKRQSGKAPRMINGITVVPNGVVYISELQEKGYSYIRP